MISAKTEVLWNGAAVRREIDELAIEEVDKRALAIIADADPAIDTGFLSASGYVNSASGLNTFDEGWPEGQYFSRRTQRQEQRRRVEAPEPHPDKGAVAGFAADYALYEEERTSFLYQAAQRAGSRG